MYREGQTATNPKTGQKIVFRGGQWVNAGAGMAAVDRSKSLGRDDAKALQDLRLGQDNARAARGSAERFMSINQRAGTGGLMGIPGVSEVMGMWDPNVSSMQGVTNAMVPQMHITPGPMTDADAKLYRSALPNPNLPGDANLAQTRRIQEQDAMMSAKEAFFERWAAQNGTLNGAGPAFDRWWSTYTPKRTPRRGEGGAQQPAGARPPPMSARQPGKVYETPQGPMVWTGRGWRPANG